MNSRPPESGPASRAFALPGNAQIKVIAVLAIMIIGALFTVVDTMQGDYVNLAISIGIGLLIGYIAWLWKYTWIAAIVVGIGGFFLAPAVFWIPADFICSALASSMLVTVILQRAVGSPAPLKTIYPGLSVRPLVITQLIFWLYLFVQVLYGRVDPVYVEGYSWKNTLKAYSEEITPIGVLLTLVILRYRLPDIAFARKWMTYAMLAALVPLIAHRIYQITQGLYELGDSPELRGVLIPVINLIPNDYALRVATPVTMMWAAAGLFSWDKEKSLRLRLGCLALAFVSILGAVISSGRAVPALAMLGAMGVAFLFRRIPLLFVCGMGMLLMVVVVNVAAPLIDDLPYAIRRSVAALQFGDNEDKESIRGSTVMRDFVFDEGMKEWRSQPRIMLTGRGVLEFGQLDAYLQAMGTEEDKWINTVKTGRIHKTMGNLLLRYGIIGAVLYYISQLSILLYAMKAFRVFRAQQAPEAVLAATVVGLLMMITVLGFFQDSPFSCFYAWIVGMLVSVVYQKGVPVAELRQLKWNESAPQALPRPQGRTA